MILYKNLLSCKNIQDNSKTLGVACLNILSKNSNKCERCGHCPKTQISKRFTLWWCPAAEHPSLFLIHVSPNREVEYWIIKHGKSWKEKGREQHKVGIQRWISKQMIPYIKYITFMKYFCCTAALVNFNCYIPPTKKTW